jgi:hypothetical protein
VGYLAVWSAARSGRIATGADTSVPYLVRHLQVDDLRVPVLSASLRIEEERSADEDLSHTDETLAVLAVGRGLLAQAVTFVGMDPFALRKDTPEHEAALEWGVVPDLDHEWQTIPLARAYEQPVVVVRTLSNHHGDAAVLRVRNVSPDGFEARVQEWAYLNQLHVLEDASYLVAEAGIQAVGGLVVEAAMLETDVDLEIGWEDVPLHAPFASVPSLFSAVMTENDPDPVTVRTRDRSQSGFLLALQEEEARTDGHGLETVGWIAVEQGRGVSEDGRVLRVFDTTADHAWSEIAFGETLRGRFPFFLGQVSSTIGPNPVELRYEGLTPERVQIFLQEEQSADPEVSHAAEDVSVLVAD